LEKNQLQGVESDNKQTKLRKVKFEIRRIQDLFKPKEMNKTRKN